MLVHEFIQASDVKYLLPWLNHRRNRLLDLRIEFAIAMSEMKTQLEAEVVELKQNNK